MSPHSPIMCVVMCQNMPPSTQQRIANFEVSHTGHAFWLSIQTQAQSDCSCSRNCSSSRFRPSATMSLYHNFVSEWVLGLADCGPLR